MTENMICRINYYAVHLVGDVVELLIPINGFI